MLKNVSKKVDAESSKWGCSLKTSKIRRGGELWGVRTLDITTICMEICTRESQKQ